MGVFTALHGNRLPDLRVEENPDPLRLFSLSYVMNSVYTHPLGLYESWDDAHRRAEQWRDGDVDPSTWMEERLVDELQGSDENVLRIAFEDFPEFTSERKK